MRTVELGSVATIERKGVDPRAVAPETLYLGLEHIERGGRIIGHDTVGGAEIASTKFQFTPEHLLFGKLRPNLGKVSRPDFAGVCSTDILPIRPGKDLDRNYLAHYLAQPSMVDFAASRTSGANLPRLSPTVLATFPIPLPPLAEQRRIAAILDHADALRAKRRQVVAHHETLTQSIFLHIFGDPVSADPARLTLLPELLVRPPQNGAYFTKDLYDGGGVEMVHMSDAFYETVQRGCLKRVLASDEDLVRYGIDHHDLLLARRSLNFEGSAKPCMVPESGEPLLFESSLIRITPDRRLVSVRYLFHYLGNSRVRRQWVLPRVTGATISGINQQALANIPVLVPSAEQLLGFDSAMDEMDQIGSRHAQAMLVETDLFASLQSRAFRGEL